MQITDLDYPVLEPRYTWKVISMAKTTQSRRRFLASTAALSIGLGAAGCIAPGGSGDGDGTTAPTPTETHDEEGDHHDDEHTEDEHGHNHDEGTPENPSHEVHVAMRTDDSGQHFDPHIAWIEVGGTVTWENESGQHNAVAYHPSTNDKPRRIPEDGEFWETDLLTEPGAIASHTFETAGVYDYYCEPHEGVGMVGTVVVGEPDAHEQPALEEPQENLPDAARNELSDLAETVNVMLGHTH